MHVLYIEPFERTVARNLDIEGDLRRSLTAGNLWFQAQTGGPRLRFDTCNGDIDITFVKLPSSTDELTIASGLGDSQYVGPLFIRERLQRLLAPLFTDPKKLYLMVWDGLSYRVCGGAPWPPALSGHFTGLYRQGLFAATYVTANAAAGATTLQVEATYPLPTPPFDATVGTTTVRVTSVTATSLTLQSPLAAAVSAKTSVTTSTTIPPCGSNPFSVDGAALGYAEFSMVHELMHPLGIVPTSAMDFAMAPVAGGHLNEGNPAGTDDLMYQGSMPWTCSYNAPSAAMSRCRLDPGHRNYFQVPGATGVDLSKSAFLDPTPVAAQPPPGW